MIKYEVMALRIYNSLTHEKEAFTPVTEGRVRLYVCGVTATATLTSATPAAP